MASGMALFEIGKNLQFQLRLWITTLSVNLVLLVAGVSPRFSDKRWIHATRNFAAMVYALGSVVLLLCLGIDAGPARFTRTRNDAWQLLAATSVILMHGFWAWTQLLHYVSVPRKLARRWRESRGRILRMDVAEELHNFHTGAAPIPVPPPPTIPAPVIHYHGPLSDALSQAIRAGVPEVAEEVGKGGSLFGAQGQLVYGARGALHSEAVQQGLFEAEGGAGSGGGFPGVGVCGVGGLALSDQETNWGWALGLMCVIQTISYGVFGFFSYLDIIRIPAVR